MRTRGGGDRKTHKHRRIKLPGQKANAKAPSSFVVMALLSWGRASSFGSLDMLAHMVVCILSRSWRQGGRGQSGRWAFVDYLDSQEAKADMQIKKGVSPSRKLISFRGQMASELAWSPLQQKTCSIPKENALKGDLPKAQCEESKGRPSAPVSRNLNPLHVLHYVLPTKQNIPCMVSNQKNPQLGQKEAMPIAHLISLSLEQEHHVVRQVKLVGAAPAHDMQLLRQTLQRPEEEELPAASVEIEHVFSQ